MATVVSSKISRHKLFPILYTMNQRWFNKLGYGQDNPKARNEPLWTKIVITCESGNGWQDLTTEVVVLVTGQRFAVMHCGKISAWSKKTITWLLSLEFVIGNLTNVHLKCPVAKNSWKRRLDFKANPLHILVEEEICDDVICCKILDSLWHSAECLLFKR